MKNSKLIYQFNKKHLEKLNPQQQIAGINDAYQRKLHDNETCRYHYAENKEFIQQRQKQYRNTKKTIKNV